MRGESQYYRGPAGYGYADSGEECWYRQGRVLGGRAARWLLLTAALLTGLLLAVITVHLAGPWTAVPGPGR
jgi:hypothetical protein